MALGQSGSKRKEAPACGAGASLYAAQTAENRRIDLSGRHLRNYHNGKRIRTLPECVLDRHAIVTYTLTDVMDLQLDGFSIQNVIFGLILRRAPDRPERRGYLALDPLPQDIELEPCYGLSGLIRVRSVSVAFEPGTPSSQDG